MINANAVLRVVQIAKMELIVMVALVNLFGMMVYAETVKIIQ